MRISFSSHCRCEKAFKPMKIVPKKDSWPGHYNIYDDKDNFVGEFTFYDAKDKTGFVEDLKIPKGVRGSRISSNILFSVRDFILNQAKENNLDAIRFSASTQNPYNVIKLYKKLFTDIRNAQVNDCVDFVYPLNKSGEQRAKELLAERKAMLDAYKEISEKGLVLE